MFTTTFKRVQPRFARFLLLLVALWISSSLAACSSETTKGDPSNLSRAIQNKGSDTLVNVALAWAEAYQKVDPSVSIAVTGGGTGTGIAALIKSKHGELRPFQLKTVLWGTAANVQEAPTIAGRLTAALTQSRLTALGGRATAALRAVEASRTPQP